MKITNLILSNDANTVVRILVLCGIAWLPLAVLTIIDGTFMTTNITIPFIKDVVPFTKALVAIPLLIMADNVIEPMMAAALKYLQTSGVVPEAEKADMDGAVEKLSFLINARWIQFVLALLAILVGWKLQADYVGMWTERSVTSWALQLENGEVDLTMAGTWFLLVTSPMASFLLYRWVWRFIAWSKFLYHVSRLELELYASHSDLAGGLGKLGNGQFSFGIVFMTMAALVSSELATQVIYEGEKLVDVKPVVLVFIIFSVAIIVAPLFFFAKKLFKLKRDALVEYGALQHRASRDFHQHWINGEGEELVDSIQPSAMADYNVVYQVVSDMRIVPLTLKAVVILVVMLLIPFTPLTLTEFSIWDVLSMILDSML